MKYIQRVLTAATLAISLAFLSGHFRPSVMDEPCLRCGNLVNSSALFCPACGAKVPKSGMDTSQLEVSNANSNTDEALQPPVLPGQRPAQLPYIPNNLPLAVVATLLCWPLGVPAIVYAAQVDGLVRSGQIEAARRHAELAKKWSFWAFGLLSAGVLIYFLIFFGMFAVMMLVPVITQQ